jgi:hypothetical protein
MKKIITALLALLVLSACGTNVSVSQNLKIDHNGEAKYQVAPVSYDKITRRVDPKVITRIETQLATDLAGRGLLSTSQNAYKVTIDMQEYKVKNGALRFFTSPFSGREYLESKVTVLDKNGKLAGAAVIYTYNMNIFNILAGKHAQAIASFLGEDK